jgi:hypothetical protein
MERFQLFHPTSESVHGLYSVRPPWLVQRVISVPLVLVTLLAAGQVEVRSTTNCPSAAEIYGRIDPLLPGATTSPQFKGPDLADVRVLGVHPDGTSDLLLRLFDSASVVIGQRSVSLRGTCSEMAEAVSAIFAAWKTNPNASISVETHKDATTSRFATQLPRVEAVVGAGVGVAYVGGMAASGNLEFRLGLAASHWQLRFGFTGETTRRLEFESGQVDWQHTTATLGLGWRWLDPDWLLSLDAGPVVGWATLAGSGFSSSRQQRSFEYGAVAGLRAGRKLGRWSLWVETRSTLWAMVKQARVTVSNSTLAKDLPGLDMTASLGISMAFFP